MRIFFQIVVLLLFLLVFIKNVQSADKSNLDILKSPELTSGYIPITKKDNLFYLLARSTKKNAPLVIFLNGGPGASSMTGAFVGNGPYLLSQPFSHDIDFELVKNPWSWNKIANVVYLDQPRYVGYSYGDGKYITSLPDAGQDFLRWLQLFYQRYPEFKQRPLYLTGESFAGAYIAEYSHQILQYNKNNPKNNIELAGLFIQAGVIGDDERYGLDSPPIYQLLFLCTQNLLPQKACDIKQKNNLINKLKSCVANISDYKHISPEKVKISDIHALDRISQNCREYLHEMANKLKTQSFTVPDSSAISKDIRGQVIQEPVDTIEFHEDSQVRQYLGYSPGPYNMKLACKPSGGFPPWCYDNYKITKFFNDADVKSLLGNKLIPPQVQWEFAKYLIPITLIGSKSPIWPIESYYAEALENDVKIFFVFGKNDWSINYLSGQFIVNKITAKAYHQRIFNLLPEPLDSMTKLTTSDHKHAGEIKSFQNVSFVQIDDAGHMIGMDQPEIIYKLFSSLVSRGLH